MAKLKPFRAWRPRPDVCAEVASPPYDVLSSAEAREMVAENPLSFLHVVKPEIDLEPGTDVYAPEVYETGAANLRRLVDDGALIREEKPALYLYRQRMGDHVQTGLVAGASVDEYEADLIKKHEHTRPVKEDDRTRHIDALDANTGPVFLTYKARPEIDALVERLTTTDPTYDFVAPDGIQHVLWVVDSPADRDALVDVFAEVPELYVADGHHRSAAGTRIRALRRDANPDHTGDESYNKVDLSKIDKRVFKKECDDAQLTIYSAVVYSVSLKRNIRVAYTEFKDTHGKVRATKLFFSTDVNINGIDIVKYYKARFQIEYLYRDAKQFTGLQHGQSRSLSKMNNHFNISLTSVSIGKVLLRGSNS